MGHASKDGRGRQPPSNKIPNSKQESVRKHINSFPAMDSHCARSKYKNQKKILQKDLNIKQMYRLFCESVASEPEKLVNESYYRDVLQTDFPNLAFHKPKKDECSYCFSFKSMTPDQKAQLEEDFNQHHERKLSVG